METKFWKIEQNQAAVTSYQEAAALIKAGGTVAFPTETVYGLGADATNEKAIQKIYQAKGRPSDNPLIVHVDSMAQMSRFIKYVPKKAEMLMKTFCPGPITFILPLKEGKLAENVTGGLESVGVRIPNHPVALELLRQVGCPIAAPSANSSGRPSPTAASHVAEDLSGKIAGLIDGGLAGIGLESTVIDCLSSPPTILRPGGIPVEEIESVIGKVVSARSVGAIQEAPKSPGMKYTHYAPRAPIYLISGSPAFFQRQICQSEKRGEIVGLLITKELSRQIKTTKHTVTLGSKKDIFTIAKTLYEGLRSFDHTPVSIIFAEVYPRINLGEAVMNRLEKAAGNKYLKEKE